MQCLYFIYICCFYSKSAVPPKTHYIHLSFAWHLAHKGVQAGLNGFVSFGLNQRWAKCSQGNDEKHKQSYYIKILNYYLCNTRTLLTVHKQQDEIMRTVLDIFNQCGLDVIFTVFLPPSCRAMWTVISLLLALSSGALSLDKLDMCMDAKHHKQQPGPEGELYLQVMNTNVLHQR